jgi:Uma2 family endonuclease
MEEGDNMRFTSAARLGYADLVAWPDDGRRHELIDGDHWVMPSPLTSHQRIVVRLCTSLSAYLAEWPAGEVLVAPVDVVLSPHDVVVPDLIVVLREQSGLVTDAHVRGAPAVVVEVLSPGTRARDATLKRDLYHRAGVREYWMVDPDRASVLICRWDALDGTAEESELAAKQDEFLTSPILPGWSFPLRAIFGPRSL